MFRHSFLINHQFLFDLHSSKSHIVLELLNDLLETIRDWIIHNFATESQKLALKKGLSLGVVSHDKEPICGSFWQFGELLFAGLHTHFDVVFVALLLKFDDVRAVEGTCNDVEGVGGRNEVLAAHVAGGLGLLLLAGLTLLVLHLQKFHFIFLCV